MDRVKNYTNIFFLQSGPLQYHPENINKIGDYAVTSGLHFVVYFGTDSNWLMKTWLDTYDNRWGEKFLGVYFGDEPGGKMLDSVLKFYDPQIQSSLIKRSDRGISGYSLDENTTMTYWQDGKIEVTIIQQPKTPPEDPFLVDLNQTNIIYYPNGSVIVKIFEDPPFSRVVEDYDLPYTYEELWDIRPFQTYDETAERFTKKINSDLNLYGPKNFSYLTSDYALYWYDFKGGYDVVLAQIGWNHSLAQDIGLVRGAANLQEKSWGAIITWKYNHPPFLDTGEAIFDQIRCVYESGGEYAVVFNYAENMIGPYGILEDEHFIALERVWNEVVQNPEVKQGSINAESVLVLPENYGWGMRRVEDTVWGLWDADEKSSQIWSLLNHLIDEYGLNLDIVYADAEFPVEGKYEEIFYWNQPA